MNAILAIIRLLRLPNLAIVFLTQYIPYWYVLRPAILKSGGIPVLTNESFGMIAAATMLTTLAGYILNDYYDRGMDAINKPRRLVWGRFLPISIALFLYAALITSVHVLAFLIDRRMPTVSHWPLIVFPSVSFLLFLYAWQFKCTAIIGNVLVSFLCAVVPVIMLIPEDRPIWLCSFQQPDAMQQSVSLVWLYALFAFITNLLREQIKDLEDFSGDSACGCTTLAVMKGPRFAKKPAGFTGLTVSILIAFLIYFWSETAAPRWQLIAGVVFLLIPALITTFWVYRAKSKKDFSYASVFVKIIMFVGLFLLLRSWPNELF